MKIEVTSNGGFVLKEVYSGVLLETKEGNQIGICMRDDTFEINIIEPVGISHWFRVDMQNIEMIKEVVSSKKVDAETITQKGELP